VRYVDIHPEDGTLDLDDFRTRLGPRTRLVAVGCASNALGTINDVRTIASWAHQVGAWVFVDAVHFAPHGPIDVQKWGCDFLACSAYKFFGPHVGVLWGRRELLEELPVYKLRPVPESLPDRWLTGTQNHEGLAGVAAAVDYLAEVGATHPVHRASFPALSGRRLALHAGMAAIQEHEAGLSNQLLEALEERPRFKVWGVRDRHRLPQRAPTIAITMEERTPQRLAEHLAARQIYVWNGNMYAMGLTERLNLEHRGGFLRIGLVHTNTFEEIERLLTALDEL